MALDTAYKEAQKRIPAQVKPLHGQPVPKPRPIPSYSWSTTLLLIAGDLALLTLSGTIAGFLFGSEIGILAGGSRFFLLFGAGMLLSGALLQAYRLPNLRRPRRRAEAAMGQAVGGLITTLILASNFSTNGVLLKAVFVPALFVGLTFLVFRSRLSLVILKWAGDERGPVERILIIGAGRAAVRAARCLVDDAGDKVRILGFADSAPTRDIPKGYPAWHIDSPDEIADLARDQGAHQVLVAQPQGSGEDVIRLTDILIRRGIRVRVVSNLFTRLVESGPFERLDGIPVVEVGATPLRGHRAISKRVLNLVAALTGTILILPLLIVIALAIKLTSRGPILHTQVRLGKGGRPFTFYKFRSMIPEENGESHRSYVTEFMTKGRAAGCDENGQQVYKFVDGNRITAIGRFLRRTSLDELPQLINVIRGEMSLVGPRPCLPFEYQLYKDWQKRRLDVIPGMTGLWQVTGRNMVTFEDMVLLDLFYIANWSFLLDIKLLLRTIPVVLWGKGGL
ncbi:MAG: exopolysaccharide biosynthesis polyprenyl glycosylphosphotransferase [Candidatus Eisenbacteria bacterium]|uniref:Exopolysaccharide biosynthesis polyprenyl glycosylphosphotransferase n=1 Tax=Eiseniibacteriota bacterium TaxID=2212470 RepID=A0A948RZQ1_UNCEI|nr:exopolysaccharide biosynthesis polyprenyl glycosylphosphotransferase [Candidatus Eisenbacteria bacterium]MBU1948222.1 exopolysaccharide biosynthesis polyprenyl glycosylphosphotransferase [Candidatus Eisenbacteria bacterium]MBU2692157.1 exopolysaccharide biosynthesis polyprenyl glycosylphosphotransferase [Candidatus Eisenbacteria bacterium]